MATSTTIPGTGKRKRHNPERREWRGVSYRSNKLIRDMRADAAAKADDEDMRQVRSHKPRQ